jgi:hypothetical protein
MSWIIGPIYGVFALVALALFVLKLWALIDACLQPAQAYVAADKWQKVGWVVILAVGLLFAGLGLLGIAALVAAIVYLVDVRPALREARGRR